MKPLQPVPMRLASHGLALVIGCAAAVAFKDEFKSEGKGSSSSSTTSARSGRNEATASVWLDESLESIRKEAKKALKEPEKPLTVAEFLIELRIDADQERKEDSDSVDGIIAESAKYANLADPADALRRSMLPDAEIGDSLAIFNAWLDKDPKAALAELARNWKLQEASYLSSLLERKFGREWLIQQVHSKEFPYRLQKALAERWGQNLAWEGGLEEFMSVYQSLSDPQLKGRLANSFSSVWPRDNPEKTGSFLKGNVSHDLQEYFLQTWSPRFSCFATSYVSPTDGPSSEWLERVRRIVSPNPWPYSPASPEVSNDPDQAKAPVVSEKDEWVNALPGKISTAIDEGTDLEELFGDGKISREKLLSELALRIPGSETYPKELERAALQAIAETSDPVQVASWATDLFNGREMDGPLKNMNYSESGEPRMSRRMNTFRELAAAASSQELPDKMSGMARFSFESWKEISPGAALAWRNSLPANDRLRALLEKGKDAP